RRPAGQRRGAQRGRRGLRRLRRGRRDGPAARPPAPRPGGGGRLLARGPVGHARGRARAAAARHGRAGVPRGAGRRAPARGVRAARDRLGPQAPDARGGPPARPRGGRGARGPPGSRRVHGGAGVAPGRPGGLLGRPRPGRPDAPGRRRDRAAGSLAGAL
ncbi:MAG: hypothetical protein AVDCRST_MAG13-1193, partial [uncultured Solirubrobacteraceae bacterium]